MKRIIVIVAGLAMVTFLSCSKKPDTGGTATQSVANEWWVTISDGTSTSGYAALATYNTAANTNEMWIDDEGNLYEFKVKAAVDLGNLTFKATSVQNEYYNIKVTITDGKILRNAAKSKTGNVTDSINFKAVFTDDPGTTYTFAGHARTRFSEDDY